MSELNPHLAAALAYATRLHWPVFPCKPKDKRPLSKKGLKDATTEEHIIRLWWKNWPDANIGIPTGQASGFDVLDVDEGGEETLAELVAEYGPLPETVEQLTGSGGRHILFRHRGGVRNSAKRLPGLDVRGEGGYIVVSPSIHPNGREYAWELSSRPGEVDLAEWPAWCLDLVQPTNGQVKKPAPSVEDRLSEGKRNETLFRFALELRRQDCTAEEIEALLLVMNQRRCDPPLPEDEVRQIAANVTRYKPAAENTPVVDPASIDWPDPQPLPAPLPAVEEFDPALLPEAFRPWIEDVAERMQCPPDFPAVAAMVALAVVVGRQVGIRPRQRDDWLVVPNLWGAVVGRPGVLKTPAIQEPLKALDRLEARAREQYQAEQKEHEAGRLVAEERKKLRQGDIRQALKNGQDPRQAALEAVEEETEAVRQRYVCNDTTVEKLGEILKGNPRGVLLFRDELTGFLKSLDREGREGDRAFYLEAWNGTGRFTYDRIGRGTIDIEATCVSILGGIQPGPLSHYLRRMAQGGADNDGLLQRFQLAVWPDLSGAWENHDHTPDLPARQVAYAVFDRLDTIDPGTLGAVQEEGTIPFLRFTPAAQEVFTEWRTDLEHRIRDEEIDLLEAHLAKFRSLVPSLALLIHLADTGQGPVEEVALRRACAWAEYLESHARRIYSPALSPGGSSAHALAGRLRKGGLHSGFTLRELYRKHWHALASREEAQEAVDVLEEMHWLHEVQERTEGRWTTRYEVNPQVVEV